MEFRLVNGAAAEPWADAVLEVWQSAFGPVADRQDWRDGIWQRHRARADYRLALAVDVPSGPEPEQAPDGSPRSLPGLAGFAWGYTGERGQYFADLMVDALGDAADDWVGGHFEFVELAVSPAARHSGIGRRLHDLLLSDLPHDRALLSTVDDDADPAVRLYRSRGWQSLGRLPGTTAQIMGRRPAAVGPAGSA